MPIRLNVIVTIGTTALVAASCSSLNPFGRDEPRAATPPPIAAAPTGPVSAAPLPPPVATAPAEPPPPATGLAALDSSQTGAAVPVAPPATGSNVEVGRTDLLGGWTINAAGDSCQLFMTLTTWSGGYRASTRGCSSSALQTVSAWKMEGNQVQLLTDSGTTLARLYPASKTQFSGQTDGGGPVSVSR